jgi:hypothetical protein
MIPNCHYDCSHSSASVRTCMLPSACPPLLCLVDPASDQEVDGLGAGDAMGAPDGKLRLQQTTGHGCVLLMVLRRLTH